MAISLPILSKRRECGECQACCEISSIAELAKPARTRCKYQCQQGCAVHGTTDQPRTCVDFRCLWLALSEITVRDKVLREALRKENRPDKLGFMLVIINQPPFVDVLGVYNVNVNGNGETPEQRRFLWELEKTTLFKYGDTIRGPQHLIDAWAKANRVNLDRGGKK